MTRSTAPGTAAVVALVLAGLAGGYLAQQAGAFLAISFDEKPLDPEPQVSTAGWSAVLPVLAPVAAIVLPAGAADDDLLGMGAAELADALQLRTGARPQVLEATGTLPPGRVIRVDATRDGNHPEAFRIRSAGRDLVISGATQQARAYGMVHLALSLSAGAGEEALVGRDQVVEPALRYRFVDLGGVGIVPDSAAWSVDDYSHHNRAFLHMVRAEPPYVDPAALAEVQEQFRVYARRVAAYGYNGIIVPGFLQFVNFDGVGSGFEVYDRGSEYRQRHLALRQAYGEMFRYAGGLGLAIVLATDMVALTEPLERYLRAQFGGIDLADPRVLQVYRAGMAELYETFPGVDGVMVRIGEAGTVYNLPGWNYRSELHVRSDTAVQAMLRGFDEVAAEHGRRVFFRTWTVGVGQVGDLHTNPDTYERVLAELNLPNTVFSTKFVTGDFYSFLPVNPTLFTGDQPRMIELQARREFEGFAAFPNYLGPLHQQLLRQIREGNPRVDGIWLWTQEGGPPRAGPWSTYPFHGFWQLVDADVYVAARLAWNPDADVRALTAAWVRRTFGGDPDVVEPLTALLLRSREPVLGGLYVGEFARHDVRALGLEPPPMMWIFEWDILTGSSAVLSAMYHTSRGNVEGAVAEGFAAVEQVRHLRALAESVDRSAVSQPAVYDNLLRSLAYQENLFHTLAWYRQAFLSHFRWLDTGDPAAYRAWRTAHTHFQSARNAHEVAYGNDLDFPAFAFFDADMGAAHAERGRAMSWLARVLLGGAVFTLLAGSRPVQRHVPRLPGRGGFRALLLATTRPWRLKTQQLRTVPDVLAAGAWPLLLAMGAHLAFSSLLSPRYLVLVGVLVGCFLAACIVPNRRRAPLILLAGINGPLLVATVLLLTVVAVRGPLFFWYGFWIRDGFRTALFVLGAMALGWLLFAVYHCARWSCGRSARQSIGVVTLGVGAPILGLGTLLHAVGLERALSTINDEMAILPMGLSRILGITTHLNIPPDLPRDVLLAGALLCFAGILLFALRPPGKAPSPHSDADTPHPGDPQLVPR